MTALSSPRLHASGMSLAFHSTRISRLVRGDRVLGFPFSAETGRNVISWTANADLDGHTHNLKTLELHVSTHDTPPAWAAEYLACDKVVAHNGHRLSPTLSVRVLLPLATQASHPPASTLYKSPFKQRKFPTRSLP